MARIEVFGVAARDGLQVDDVWEQRESAARMADYCDVEFPSDAPHRTVRMVELRDDEQIVRKEG